jgi:hypothetical protein
MAPHSEQGKLGRRIRRMGLFTYLRTRFPASPLTHLPAYPLLLALIAACSGPRQDMQPAPADNSDGFSLLLTNRHLLDVNVFLQHDGQADRIAMVNASTSKVVELPLRMLGQGGAIRLIAEPIGDETRYTTDLLTVQAGQVVVLNVETPIARSNYSIQ